MTPEPPLNFWDERFRSARYFYGEAPNQFLKAHAGVFSAHGRLLGLGEGEGHNGVYLAEQGFQVTALDSSAIGLEKTALLAAQRGVCVTPWMADVTTADLGNETWDGIYNIFCHLPQAQRLPLYPKIQAALKPGGIYLTQQFSPRQLGHQSGGPQDVDLLPDLPELLDAFSGWETVVAQAETTVLDEGPKHRGEAQVINFIARKPR